MVKLVSKKVTITLKKKNKLVQFIDRIRLENGTLVLMINLIFYSTNYKLNILEKTQTQKNEKSKLQPAIVHTLDNNYSTDRSNSTMTHEHSCK